MGVFIFYLILVLGACFIGAIITDIILPLLEVIIAWLFS